jgi:hypothetical protein
MTDNDRLHVLVPGFWPLLKALPLGPQSPKIYYNFFETFINPITFAPMRRSLSRSDR